MCSVQFSVQCGLLHAVLYGMTDVYEGAPAVMGGWVTPDGRPSSKVKRKVQGRTYVDELDLVLLYCPEQQRLLRLHTRMRVPLA